jgi:hypothetical protein
MKPTLGYRLSAAAMLIVVCAWLSFQSVHQWLDHHFSDHHHHSSENAGDTQNDQEDCPFCKIQVTPFISENPLSIEISKVAFELERFTLFHCGEVVQCSAEIRLRGPPLG